MNLHAVRLSFFARPLSMILACLVLLPMSVLVSGCGNSGGSSSGGTTAPAATPASEPTNSPMSASTPPPAPVPTPKKQGMSTGEKAVIVLAGAALLYYLYKKHQQAAANQAGAGTAQLYRSQNGGIYYRNAQHQAVWVTAPTQGVAVPASQVQQYAPDYQQYQNQAAPAAPAGAQTQSATQFDPSLAGSQ